MAVQLHDHGERFCDRRSIEKVRSRFASTACAGDKIVFLVMSGAFNPVHTQHVRALEIARSYLESLDWTVVGGFLAPSSDAYVTEKLRSEALSFVQRRTLCELAVEGSDWMTVCSTGEMSSNWIRRAVQNELERDLGKLLEGRRLEGVELMASDTVMRIFDKILAEKEGRPGESTQQGRIICWFVRPGLSGSADHIETTIVPGAGKLGVKMMRLEPNLFGPPLKAVSSSAVRRLLSQNDWQALHSNGWLDPEVARTLDDWGGKRL
jgi:hypothetical protein